MVSAINLSEKPILEVIGRNMHVEGRQSYLLPSHWSLHLYDYRAVLRVDDEPFQLFPGAVTLVPPNTPVEYNFSEESTHLFVHFALPEPASTNSISLPVFYDMRDDLYIFEKGLLRIGRAFIFDNNRVRAEVRLWDMLWDLTTHGQSLVPTRHPCIEKALSLINAKLGDDISVVSLAREVGLSRNHLTRLFRQETGLTVIAYVRQQRARKAKQLLEHTTMPMRSVAEQVNAPNLQSFSTLIKKETGHSPGHWRRHG